MEQKYSYQRLHIQLFIKTNRAHEPPCKETLLYKYYKCSLFNQGVLFTSGGQQFGDSDILTINCFYIHYLFIINIIYYQYFYKTIGKERADRYFESY